MAVVVLMKKRKEERLGVLISRILLHRLILKGILAGTTLNLRGQTERPIHLGFVASLFKFRASASVPLLVG